MIHNMRALCMSALRSLGFTCSLCFSSIGGRKPASPARGASTLELADNFGYRSKARVCFISHYLPGDLSRGALQFGRQFN